MQIITNINHLKLIGGAGQYLYSYDTYISEGRRTFECVGSALLTAASFGFLGFGIGFTTLGKVGAKILTPIGVVSGLYLGYTLNQFYAMTPNAINTVNVYFPDVYVD